MPTWTSPPTHAINSQSWAAKLGLHPITAQILLNRGITTLEAAQLFLEAPIAALHDPLLLPDIEPALTRLIQAISQQERIILFGDYDTDGVCGTALMTRFLRQIGVTSETQLPNRYRDGYGVTPAAIEKIAAAGGGLLITIDNGSSAHAALQRAQQLQIDVIITDHHRCGDTLPPALACINPQRADSAYPFKHLCGTGVVFKLLIALRARLRDQGFFATRTEPNLQQLLPLVAIATIADVMPLVAENRILVKRGLQILAQSPSPGLAALMRLAEVDPSDVSSEAVAFRISPRLNAAGRMTDPEIAWRCLSSDNPVEAAAAAETLQQLNQDRQQLEQKILKHLAEPTQTQHLETCAGIAVGSDDWPVGVVGIIAGRLAKQYGRPAVVVSFQGDVGRGSVRQVPGIDLIEVLNDCADTLVAFGGHTQAAGVTVQRAQWPAFQAAFARAVAQRQDQMAAPQQAIDAVVDATDITPALGRDLQKLVPFGAGNPEPILAVRPITVKGRRQIGTQHLKMQIGNTMITVDAIGFNLWQHPESQNPLSHVIGVPELNTWNGVTKVQLRLLDLNPKTDWL